MAYYSSALAQWVETLSSLTLSPVDAELYRESRSEYAFRIAQLLVQAISGGNIPAIYGIWLDGHASPVYIGHTVDARRRLWDLPFGESHHVANTYPPEIWNRVVAIRWQDVLNDNDEKKCELLNEAMRSWPDVDDHTEHIGLMLEHRFLLKYRPRFNLKKRARDGKWRDINPDKSKAVGSTSLVNAHPLYEGVFSAWNELSTDVQPDHPSRSHRYGTVVYPSMILRTQFLHPED